RSGDERHLAGQPATHMRSMPFLVSAVFVVKVTVVVIYISPSTARQIPRKCPRTGDRREVCKRPTDGADRGVL
ncbi:MAG: hypothetical protein J2P17_13850, partial [Mycobacterium sp.]|nr:hypothetical protein [Mycobacterium sp.]